MSVVAEGKLVKLTQDDYDDGIQEIVIEFEDGNKITQTWNWGHTTTDNGDSIHEQVVYWDGWSTLTPDQQYGLISRLATQQSGPVLTEQK